MLDLSVKYEVYEIQNYRPLSILSNLSKVYEKCQFNEMVTHFDDILPKYQCGFRKGFSTQHFLIVLVENWKKKIGTKGCSLVAILADLLNFFDCLLHDLLISKLHAHGLDMASLKLIYIYLCGGKQRVKINDKHSSWEEILFGLPQGFILEPSLFNIFYTSFFYSEMIQKLPALLMMILLMRSYQK